MKADTVDLAQVFGMTVRYEVPLFQRPYVWERDKQWQPLWDDVKAVAVRQIDDTAANDSTPHFIGAIVVDQEVRAGGPTVRGLIDGQQRLTTLQLVVAAARAAAAEVHEVESIGKLEALLFIPTYLLGNSSTRLKVVPTNADRAAFTAAIEKDGSPDQPIPSDESDRLIHAYRFFREAIDEWLEEDADEVSSGGKVRALTTALWSLVRVVLIALEPTDDAQVIFETLNARGTPLLAADLVKNYLFRRITAESGATAAERAHREQWSELDKKHWREEVGQGRSRRPRIDLLLTHWLVLRTESEVGFQDVYSHFKRYADAVEQPLDLLTDLRATAAIYDSFADFNPFGTEGTFFHRLDVLETTTFIPVVLRILGPGGIVDVADRRRALGAIESWLVRRMLCRKTTKNYNSIALNLLKSVSGRQMAGDDVVLFLLNLTGESQLWPADDEVLEAVRTVPYYTTLPRRRLRMVLDAIEASLHDPKVGPYADRDRLTIEHILPQTWHLNWPLPPGPDDVRRTIERDTAKHRMGNLALVTQPLNSALSNAPWNDGAASKRGALSRYNQYLINKQAIESDRWDEGTIAARTEWMAKRILEIWPKPSRTTEQSAGVPDLASTQPEKPFAVEVDEDDGYAAVPEDVRRLIAKRGSPKTQLLARQFAMDAIRREGVELRAQKSINSPWYFQVRHPRFNQVVAYAHPRPDDLRIEYRLPSTSETYGVAQARDNFYGIVLKLTSPAELDISGRLLDDALSRPN